MPGGQHRTSKRRKDVPVDSCPWGAVPCHCGEHGELALARHRKDVTA